MAENTVTRIEDKSAEALFIEYLQLALAVIRNKKFKTAFELIDKAELLNSRYGLNGHYVVHATLIQVLELYKQTSQPGVRGNGRGKIYFYLNRDGYIKIGKTNGGIEERAAQLKGMSHSTGSIIHFMKGDFTLETRLHKRFEKYRVNGEWFEYSSEIREFIEKDQAKQREKLTV